MKQLSFFSSKPAESIEKFHWVLYIDGASRGNPGLAGAGICLLKNDSIVAKKSFFLGTKTNNQAEYMALIHGLTVFKEQEPHKRDHLTIYSDSELLVRQVKGLYKIKNLDLKQLYDTAIKLLCGIDYKIEHIRREKNCIADDLANKAIDKRNSK